jgi:predicted transcriptional regulator
LAIRKPIDNLLFLSILLDAVSNDPRVGISEIAERVSMTYQGVVNRLKALELRLDGPEMAQRIHNRMEEERGQIQPYADWLKHCLQLG